MQSRTVIRQLSEQPLVRDLSVEAAQAVLALRYSILCRRSGHDPMPELERRWGNILAARRFRLVVEAIAHVWPDPFAVAPPCCPRLSFDEALLAAIVGAASRRDRVDFDWRTAEMLGSDAREMLFAALENFIRAKAPGRV
ncbi:MAG: addiction module antidote protein [Pseudomonadota bacterium]